MKRPLFPKAVLLLVSPAVASAVFFLAAGYAAADYFESAYNAVPRTGDPNQLQMLGRFGDFADIGGWTNNYEPEVGDEVGAFWTNQSDEEILVGVTTVNETQAAQNIYGLLTIYGELSAGFGGGTELSHGLKEGATIYFRVYPLSRLSEYPANPTLTFANDLEPGRHDLAVELPPTATPTVTPTASVTATPTASATPSASATATPTASVTPSIAPTPSPAPTAIPPMSRWYLPAGAIKSGQTAIDTYILVANPNQQTVPLKVDFVGRSGFISFTEVEMPPRSRSTFKLTDSVDFEDDSAESVSTIVTSRDGWPVFAERAMYFPGGGWNNWTGGHATIGITELAGEWNLPEGATHLFDHFIHVLNPGPDYASVTANFMGKDGFAGQTDAVIAPLHNWTILVNAELGERDQVSTRVVVNSGGEVAVDRTMYWPQGGADGWMGGHSSRGISAPAAVWHLAEGANHIFDHYVLVSNPGNKAALVTFTFMAPQGDPESHKQTVAPRSRYTLKVNDIPGWEEKPQVSTTVAAEGGEIFVERAMYWPRGNPEDWTGGHNSIGAPAPAERWHLPEGATHHFDMYVLVANPSDAVWATATFTFMDQTGFTAQTTRQLASQSRQTVHINSIPGWEVKEQVSTLVESNFPILVERAMYWPRGKPENWQGGHATIGIEEP